MLILPSSLPGGFFSLYNRHMQNQKKTIRFGILGAGYISDRFASVLNTVADVSLTAVATRDAERAQAFAGKHHASKIYTHYEDLILDPAVDIVYVGLTNNRHFDICCTCLENHKAVLCEKPLLLTEKEALELTGLAQQNHTLLMEALWTRCMPVFLTVREWVQSGKIGAVKLIKAGYCYKADYDPTSRLFNPALGGGSLFDVGVYPIDFATGLMAEHPISISGEAEISPSGVDAAAAFSLRFAGGALASLACAFNVEAPLTVEIYGTEGSISADSVCGPMLCERFDSDNQRVERFEERVPDGFIYQIAHCADLFRQGKIECDLIPWADSIATARIYDELRKQWKLK